jgi:hypothetical protein
MPQGSSSDNQGLRWVKRQQKYTLLSIESQSGFEMWLIGQSLKSIESGYLVLLIIVFYRQVGV